MNELIVTDGTTWVNLLNLADGYSVEDWAATVAQYKGGGVWHQSALTDGARLVFKTFDNAVEEFPIPAVAAHLADNAAAALWRLLGLLEQAANYWRDDWDTTPVWLESQSDCETGKMYAHINSGGFPDIGDPYSPEYLEDAVLSNLTLRINRGHWKDNPPMQGSGLATSVTYTHDGRTVGNVNSAGTRVPVTTPDVFVANKSALCNIDEVWRYDAGAGTFTDMIAAGVPFDLFPAATGANDALIIGIESAGADDFVYDNLIFDIGTANVGIPTVWEYWNGAWVAFGVAMLDRTDTAGDAFDTAGVNGAYWSSAANWVNADLNAIYGGAAPAITAYWVRCRCTGGGVVTIPTQINRNIYTANKNYIEVQEDDIGGHIPANLKLFGHVQTDASAIYGWEPTRLMGGLRSVDRGEDFQTFINLGNTQNPAGVTVASAGAETTLQGSIARPAYFYYEWQPVGPGDVALVESVDITISNNDFHGTFRVLYRCLQVGGSAGDIGMALQYNSGGINYTTETQYTVMDSPGAFVYDFGVHTIPGVVPFELDHSTLFTIWLSTSNAPNADLWHQELILMPVDEFAFEVSTDDISWSTSEFEYFYIDSIIDPKRIVRTHLMRIVSNALRAFWLSIMGDRFQFKPNRQQRMYFLSQGIDSNDDPLEASMHKVVFRSQMWAQQQYLTRRGSG